MFAKNICKPFCVLSQRFLSHLEFFAGSPQIAVPLLVHKIHSPQEWEALQALTVRNVSPKCQTAACFSQLLKQMFHLNHSVQVLEACMKNCGRRFHNEVGKYRFLNELIKVVSPKVSRLQRDSYFKHMKISLTDSSLPCFQYMGDSAPEKVKMKIVEMLYSWTVAFPNEIKISEAYQTLKRQGTFRRLTYLWKDIRPQWNRINPALTPFTRSGDTRPGDPTGQDSDPFSSNTTQTSCVWQRGHGQGDRLYEHTGTFLKTDLKQNKVDKKCSTITCCRWSTGWSSYFGDKHMFTHWILKGVVP